MPPGDSSMPRATSGRLGSLSPWIKVELSMNGIQRLLCMNAGEDLGTL